MTINVPPIQTFEEFEADCSKLLRPPFRSKFGAVKFGHTPPNKKVYDHIVKGLIPEHENVLIYGASQSGKSFLTSDIALSVARAVDFFGRKTKQGLVIYCAAEAGRGFAAKRMPAYERYHQINEPVPFVCLTEKFDIYGNKETTDELIKEVKAIAEEFKEFPLAAIVIDTFNKTTPGMDEISGKDVGIVVERLERIQKQCGAAIWLGLKSGSWAGAEFWSGNQDLDISNIDRSLNFTEVVRRSEVITVGIDGGGLDDLLALAVLGKEPSGQLLLWTHAWAHEVVKKRRTEIASKLDELSDAKVLTFVKRPGDDVYELADYVFQIEKTGKLAAESAVGVDTFGIAAIKKALAGDGIDTGIDEGRLVGIPQGWKLNGAIKDTERDLAGGIIKHDGGPLMAFAVGNAKAVPRGNAVAIDKQDSGSAKIDPLMATLHAKVLMGLNPVPSGGPSVYETRGLLMVG